MNSPYPPAQQQKPVIIIAEPHVFLRGTLLELLPRAEGLANYSFIPAESTRDVYSAFARHNGSVNSALNFRKNGKRRF